MGPLRRRLILAALIAPTSAFAEVCDKERPGWDGTPATALSEAITLFASPLSLVLLIATAFVIRFRHQWGALITMLLWTLWVSLIAFGGDQTIRAQAIKEGCFGPPVLFIAAVAAICIAMILYTNPRPKRDD